MAIQVEPGIANLLERYLVQTPFFSLGQLPSSGSSPSGPGEDAVMIWLVTLEAASMKRSALPSWSFVPLFLLRGKGRASHVSDIAK